MVTVQHLRTDERVQRDVLDELHFDPAVRPTEIGVEVDQGIVTLTGTVDGYNKKWRAAEAVLRVHGVRAVANELDVELPTSHTRDDTDIARDAAEALERDVEVPRGRVGVTVSNGRLMLEGSVDWFYQRRAAQAAVRYLAGVREVMNLIEVRPQQAGQLSQHEIRLEIERALTRSAELEAHRLQVAVEGSTVQVSGHVRSWAQREEVGRAAWSVPGVERVDNNVQVWP